VHLGQVDEVLVGVIGHLGVDAVGHRVLAHTGLDEGVAIGRRLDRTVGAHHATGAADVLYQHRLLELFGQLLGNHSGHHVAGAARRERRDQLDRLGGVVSLGQRAQGQHGGHGGCGAKGQSHERTLVHQSLLFDILVC
jgi:hypothetical protein